MFGIWTIIILSYAYTHAYTIHMAGIIAYRKTAKSQRIRGKLNVSSQLINNSGEMPPLLFCHNLRMIPYLKVDKTFHRKTAIMSVGGVKTTINELIVVPHCHLICFTYLP